MSDTRVEQIKRAHAGARPTHLNPSWLNSHGDLAYVLERYAEMEAKLSWQPIDTAPRDGTLVLAWFENPRWPSAPGVLQWTDHNGGGWTHYPMGTPTHWMPLPSGPTPKPPTVAT